MTVGSAGSSGTSRAPSFRFDPASVRADFPILSRPVHGHPLAYLDNAATTQVPRAVTAAMVAFQERSRANVHRGVHALSERATAAYEGARVRVQRFLNARSPSEIVFVRGTTEAVNLVAGTFGRTHLGSGDEILVTTLEHHSNIVPWQLLAAPIGATVKAAPIDDGGDLVLEELDRLIGPRTRLLALTHVSNAIGTITPVRQIIDLAHDRGVPVLLDAAQAASHLRLDVQELGCDFLAFSGHKLYGPTGIGVLWGRAELLETMPPWQGGGDMVRTVAFEGTTYAPPPQRFEAGTPNVEGAVGLHAALDYLEDLGLEWAQQHEAALTEEALRVLGSVPGVRIVGMPRRRAPVISFLLDDVHPHDLGTVLDTEGVAIRAGHHCAQPLMRRLGVSATARISLAFYNASDDLQRLAEALHKAREIFAP